jgi:hypothetical protein
MSFDEEINIMDENEIEEQVDRNTSKNNEKRRQASAISSGLFLIGIAVLFLTDWWWPGIMFVIGISSGSALIFRGRLWQGISTLALFFGIPFVIWAIDKTSIPWEIAIPVMLIGIGVIIIARVLLFRGED